MGTGASGGDGGVGIGGAHGLALDVGARGAAGEVFISGIFVERGRDGGGIGIRDGGDGGVWGVLGDAAAAGGRIGQ